MARRRAADDSLVLKGGPGDPPEEEEFEEETEEDEDDDAEFEEEALIRSNPRTAEERIFELEDKLDTVTRSYDDLRRAIPPAEPRGEEAADPMDGINWDEAIFANPKEALQRYGEIVEERVANRLRGEYQRERGQERFWDDFYKRHNDLIRDQDGDIVQMLLNKNLNKFSNMPVDKAMDELADLTRQRIMQYTGKQRRVKKAVSEGAAPPSTTKRPDMTPKEPPKVRSMSDYIRERRLKRAKVQAA